MSQSFDLLIRFSHADVLFSLGHILINFGVGTTGEGAVVAEGHTGIQSTQTYKQWAACCTAQTIQTKCDKWAETHKYSGSSLP